MNRIWCFLLLFTLFLQRDTPDADELLPVTSLAVWQEDDTYHILIEGARQSSLDGNAEPVYLRASAQEPKDLFEQAQATYAEHLTFTHTSLLLLDASVPLEEVQTLCSVLLDIQGAPRSTFLAYGEDSEAILTHEHPVEEIPGLGLRDLLRSRELIHGKIATVEDGKKFPDQDLLLQTLKLSEEDQVLCGVSVLLHGTGGNP